MNALREVYDFVAGGSIVAPIGLACAIIAGSLLHAYRPEVLTAILVLTLAASCYEKPH